MHELFYILKVKHPPGKTNKDVKYLNIAKCKLKKIPKDITNTFPNLEVLDIEDTNLEEINRVDLLEYKNLKGFYCDRNLVKFLPGNLFEDFNNLESISFNGNKISVIEPNILDGLNKLDLVDFSNNVSYDCCFSKNEKSTDITLNDLRQKLIETFYSSDPENIKKYVRKFRNKIHKLTDSIQKLNIKVYRLEVAKQKLKSTNARCKVTEADLNQMVCKLEENERTLSTENKSLKAENQELQNKAAKIAKNQIKLQNEIQELVKTKNIDNNKITLNSDIKKFLQNQNFKDFCIQIDDRELKVHKFILAARSPTLAEIFLKNPEAENLKLVDITPETFKIILHFMYTDELPGDEKINYLQLYSAAGRLEINELKIFAEPKAFESLNPENAIEILVLSNKFKNNEMREKAFELIKKAYPEVPDVWIDKPEKVKKFIEIFGES
ncbi:unnamed protein product [Chironomus riparius]|uniref:BTB domain-containing protein n=1 Tax=Chironomus riparius TaxID=315576 RepID=A0A9N9S6T1_9DIPT|nr:unnamed protein product [Chironomus riparius]